MVFYKINHIFHILNDQMIYLQIAAEIPNS